MDYHISFSFFCLQGFSTCVFVPWSLFHLNGKGWTGHVIIFKYCALMYFLIFTFISLLIFFLLSTNPQKSTMTWPKALILILHLRDRPLLLFKHDWKHISEPHFFWVTCSFITIFMSTIVYFESVPSSVPNRSTFYTWVTFANCSSQLF